MEETRKTSIIFSPVIGTKKKKRGEVKTSPIYY